MGIVRIYTYATIAAWTAAACKPVLPYLTENVKSQIPSRKETSKYQESLRKERYTFALDFLSGICYDSQMTQKTLPKQRLVPYKLLVHLLYGQHSWLVRLPEGKVQVSTGPLRRYLRISSSRISEQLEWLKLNNLLLNIESPKRGIRIVALRTPAQFEESPR